MPASSAREFLRRRRSRSRGLILRAVRPLPEYLGFLTLAQSKGEISFTVDYALDPENAASVYETSRAMGFVPFVGNRALDRYVEPAP